MAYLDYINKVGKGTDYQEMEGMMEHMMVLPVNKGVKGSYIDKTNCSYGGHMGGMGKGMGYGGLHLIMGVITWMTVVALLISLARYFWNKGGEKK